MPDAFMASTTSPGPGVGSGKSSSASSQSPRNTTPFIARHQVSEFGWQGHGIGTMPAPIAESAQSPHRRTMRVHQPGSAAYTAGGIPGEGRVGQRIALDEARPDRERGRVTSPDA